MNYFIKYFLLLVLLIYFINCERLYVPPRPASVFKEASYNHRFRQWRYEDNQKEIIWFEDGKLFREAKKENQLYHGVYIQYFRNGSISQKGNYDQGYRVGEWVYYFPNGKIYLTIHYLKFPIDKNKFVLNGEFGNENGPYIRYYDNGQVEEMGTYYAGSFHQKRIRFYKNGKKQFEIFYNQGKKNGTAKFYDSEERLLSEEYYQNDLLEKLISYRFVNNQPIINFISFYKDNQLINIDFRNE